MIFAYKKLKKTIETGRVQLFHMKGITPVIAIVLLLMITIALVGFAFIWFQSTFQTTTSTASSQIDQQTTAFGKTTIIEAVGVPNSGIQSISIRNTGNSDIDINYVSAGVGGKYYFKSGLAVFRDGNFVCVNDISITKIPTGAVKEFKLYILD